MQVKAVVQLHLHSLESRGIRPVTLEKCEWELKQFVADFGEQEIKEVTFSALITWMRGLRKRDGTRYAHASLAGISKGIRSCFKFAEEEGYIVGNVSRKLPRYNYKPVHRQIASEEDIITILNALPAFIDHRGRDVRDLRDALIVSFAINTGTRLRNIKELERKAVLTALEHPSLVYTSHGVDNIYHVYTEGKGDKMLELRFSEATAELFREYFHRTKASNPTYAFVTNNVLANPIGKATANSAFQRVCEFAGTPIWLSHSIRKANVMAILDTGADIKTASEYVQHSDPQVTLVHYVYSNQRRVDEAALNMMEKRYAEAAVQSQMDNFFKRSP